MDGLWRWLWDIWLFVDTQRLCQIRRWTNGNWCNGAYDGELFNETLVSVLKAIPPHAAIQLAIERAIEVDDYLLTVPDEIIEKAMLRSDRPNFDRGAHRIGHLDNIEMTLFGEIR